MSGENVTPKRPMRPQVNVPVSGRCLVALRVTCARDGASVPQLLKAVVEEYVEGRMNEDADLRGAVEKVLRSRSRERNTTRRKVTPITRESK